MRDDVPVKAIHRASPRGMPSLSHAPRVRNRLRTTDGSNTDFPRAPHQPHVTPTSYPAFAISEAVTALSTPPLGDEDARVFQAVNMGMQLGRTGAR